MFNTFKLSYKLKSTYTANSFIFSFQQIPFIKKLVSSSLYSNKWIKGIAYAFSVFIEILSVFVFKPLYVFAFIFMAVSSYKNPNPNNFIHLFVLLSFNGLFIKANFFTASKDKFYAISLLKMDAKKYALSNYFYFLITNVIGTLPALIYFGLKSGVPLAVCLLMPFLAVNLRISHIAFTLYYTQKKGTEFNPDKATPRRWVIIITVLALAYGLPFIGIAIGKLFFICLFIASLVPLIPSVLYLLRFSKFHILFRKLLNTSNIIFDASQYQKTVVAKSVNDKLDTSEAITSSRDGYSYFHEIFIKRHRKILTKSAKTTALIFLGAIAVLVVSVLFSDQISGQINKMALTFLPYFLFIMYVSNRGQVITRAMFMNCDHSMLAYRFYRQPKAILELFTKRLKTVILINLMPSIILALGLPLLLYISGGTDNPLNYLVLFTSIISMSVFFSVHHLVIYYLLQPYNAELETKKGTMYRIINTITYFISLTAINVKLPTLLFGTCMTVFTILYVCISLFLAYRYAPKTFKLR